MSMSLSQLLKEHIIEKIEPDKKLSEEFISLSKKDLKTALDNLNSGHFNWALAIAYNSMLYAGRALIALHGYRVLSDAHHLGVIRFCGEIIPKESQELVSIFNRYRSRRHDVVYGEAKEVRKEEAEFAIENAKKFIVVIEKLLKK